jgi:site-specific DNA recombinase
VRAAALLRVSTERQVRKHQDDEETLPAQREAVRKFCQSRGWDLVQEYAEEGVSAWSHDSSERAVLQEVLAHAKEGKFDVLVIFKYDRLSRVSLEYPMLLWSLAKVGVRVWSVADDGSGRELSIDGQMDKLLRFVEGWQAETESYNTSIRVSARMRQMAERGLWTGGRPPYGFHLKNGGRQKSGEAMSLEIDEAEAEVVRLIFHLYLDEELGSTTIARHLNAMGYRLRSGKPWDDTRVRQVLKNPTVCGRPPYGRHYRDPRTHRRRRRPQGSPDILIPKEPVAEWVIVPWERFEAAQRRMQAWNPKRLYPEAERRRTKADTSPLLLTGLARCGYCQGPLTAGYAMPVKMVGGKRVQYRYPRYQDRNQAGGVPCQGQFSYSVGRLDATVLTAVRQVLESLDGREAYAFLRQRVAQGAFAHTQRLEVLRRREAAARKLVEEWTKRLDAYLLRPASSLYDEAFLAERLREAQKELAEVRHERERLERQGGSLEQRLRQLDEFLAAAPSFWQQFLQADQAFRKRLLRKLLRQVVVYRDRVDLYWRVDIGAILRHDPGAVLEWHERRPWEPNWREAAKSLG